MKLSRRHVLIGAGCALAASGMPAIAAETFVIGGPAFGTSWRLTLPIGSQASSAKTAIEKEIQFVDERMSPFKSGSELSLFNLSGTTDWFPISPETSDVVGNALLVAERSSGAFDPTIGPLVGRYGFGPITNVAIGDFTGLDLRAGAIRKNNHNLSVDLCGIAKGYTLDCVIEALERLGERSYLLELGGEVFSRGRHPTGRAWQVGIEKPVAGPLQFQRLVELKSKALATSGDVENSYEINGLRYSHIMDPRAGEPVKNNIASVSVLASNGVMADALATTLMVMGSEDGAEYAEREKIAALFIVRDGSFLREVMSGGFAAHVLT